MILYIYICIYNTYIYIYPLAFGLPATVPSQGSVVLRCTVWCLANGLPFGFRNFDTPALFKRRGNAAQILIFILWLGHSVEHPKVAQITSKSSQNRSKISKDWYLEWLWAPLGSPWRPLGHHLGPRRQKPWKKWLGGPPPGSAFRLNFHTFW